MKVSLWAGVEPDLVALYISVDLSVFGLIVAKELTL